MLVFNEFKANLLIFTPRNAVHSNYFIASYFEINCYFITGS